MSRKCLTILCSAFFFLCVNLIGCASIRPDPFIQFNDAVKEAGKGMDAAMLINYNWTRSGFIGGFSMDTASRFSELIVQPGEKYSWSMIKTPLYFDIKKARSTLSELNNAFIQYASLLLKLSGGELVNPDKFDLLAKDLNKSIADALAALKKPPSSAGSTALVSKAFTEAARLYIEHKKRRYLTQAIKNNQDNIKKYSGMCIKLLHTITADMKTYYVENYTPIKEAWNSSSGEKRQKPTKAMLDLDDRFIDVLGILQALEATYTVLPAAHADLSKAIAKTKLPLEGIQQLFSSGKRLQMLYAELKNADQ